MEEKTLMNRIGEWHQKLADWAHTDEQLPTWKVVFRSTIYVLVNVVLEFVLIWGVFMTFIMLFGRFFVKDDFEE